MSRFRGRIEALAERARADRRAFEPPADPPDEERAVEFLRDGVGDAVSVYVEARTGEYVPLDREEMDLLERAMNDWLELYARCHGREIEAAFTVRAVTEAVVMDTRDLVEAARVVTGVPDRGDGDGAWRAGVSRSNAGKD